MYCVLCDIGLHRIYITNSLNNMLQDYLNPKYTKIPIKHLKDLQECKAERTK